MGIGKQIMYTLTKYAIMQQVGRKKKTVDMHIWRMTVDCTSNRHWLKASLLWQRTRMNVMNHSKTKKSVLERIIAGGRHRMWVCESAKGRDF